MAALDSEFREPSLHDSEEPTTAGDATVETTRDSKEEKVEKEAEEAPTTTAVAASDADADADADAADDREKPPPPPKPKPCSSCGADSKYQCPRCGARSCSAPCVGKHKEATGCTGKRDRAAFVPVSAMTEATLASDIGLLEEVERAAAAARRGAALPAALADAVAKASKGGATLAAGGGGGSSSSSSGHRARGAGPSSSDGNLAQPSQPPHLQQLVSEASRRGVRLRLAPPGFEARLRNATRYDGRQKKVHWHLEWRLLLLSGEGEGGEEGQTSSSIVKKAEDRRVREEAPLGPFLRRHLEGGGALAGSGEGGAAAEATAAAPAAAGAATAAAAAAAAPLPFRALLRLDGRPANSPGWLDFSLKSENCSFFFDEEVTLAELLRGRTVDEFPVVALVAAGSPLPPGEIVAFSRAAPLPPPAAAPPPPVASIAEENKEVSQL